MLNYYKALNIITITDSANSTIAQPMLQYMNPRL
jgi:hypothetical protein